MKTRIPDPKKTALFARSRERAVIEFALDREQTFSHDVQDLLFGVRTQSTLIQARRLINRLRDRGLVREFLPAKNGDAIPFRVTPLGAAIALFFDGDLPDARQQQLEFYERALSLPQLYTLGLLAQYRVVTPALLASAFEISPLRASGLLTSLSMFKGFVTTATVGDVSYFMSTTFGNQIALNAHEGSDLLAEIKRASWTPATPSLIAGDHLHDQIGRLVLATINANEPEALVLTEQQLAALADPSRNAGFMERLQKAGLSALYRGTRKVVLEVSEPYGKTPDGVVLRQHRDRWTLDWLEVERGQKEIRQLTRSMVFLLWLARYRGPLCLATENGLSTLPMTFQGKPVYFGKLVFVAPDLPETVALNHRRSVLRALSDTLGFVAADEVHRVLQHLELLTVRAPARNLDGAVITANSGTDLLDELMSLPAAPTGKRKEWVAAVQTHLIPQDEGTYAT